MKADTIYYLVMIFLLHSALKLSYQNQFMQKPKRMIKWKLFHGFQMETLNSDFNSLNVPLTVAMGQRELKRRDYV